MAYLNAYDRGHTEDALRFGKQHDDDALQCQRALALLQRAVGDNPRHWDVGDAWQLAVATDQITAGDASASRGVRRHVTRGEPVFREVEGE